MLHCQYTYAALLVQGCCTFGARVLHFYWHYYFKVFTAAFLLAKSFDFRLILIVPWNSNLECRIILASLRFINKVRRSRQFFIGFPFGRRTLFLHSSFFIGFPFGRRTSFLHSSFSKQPQAVTLANPFIIPMHQKKQRSKKSVVKDSVCISAIRELFF